MPRCGGRCRTATSACRLRSIASHCGASGCFGSVKSAALVEVRARGPRWSEAAATIRAWSRETLHRTIGQRDPEAAGVVTAVLIGDRAGLSADVEQRLQRAGTFHIIAISGGNVAVLAGIVLFLVARTGLSPRVRALTGMTTLVVYAGTVMGGASVTRATLAAAIYLGARAGDLRTGGRSVMAATLATIVAMDPVLVADPGFWLTFLASLAIVERAAAVSARIERGWLSLGGWPQPPIVRSVVVLFAATLVAETILVPVTAYVFAQVTAAGLVLNFAAIPAMAVVQIAGLATLAAAAVHPVLASAPGAIAALAARTILESAGLVRYAPWAVWRVPPPPLWLVAVALAAWLAAAFSRRRSGRIAGAAACTVAMAAILLGPVLPAFDDTVLRHPACHEPEFPGALLRLTILDVGQGASVLVRLPDGRSFLVDAGGGAARSRFDVGGRVVSPAVWALGVRRLSALVLTHGDIDHVGGAPALVEDVVPSAIWEGVPVSGLPALDAVRRAAEQHAVPWLRVTRGDAFKLSEVALQVWHPPRSDWERRRVRNDDSIVLELRVGRVSVILPGDIGAGVEGELATLVQPAAVRVLLAAHHGSRGSTSGRWLQALDPDVVIVSRRPRAIRTATPRPPCSIASARMALRSIEPTWMARSRWTPAVPGSW